MNSRGGFEILLNMAAFICCLLLAGLVVIIADPIADAMLDTNSEVAPEGGTARMIIFGAAFVVILAGAWFLTRPEGQLGWGL